MTQLNFKTKPNVASCYLRLLNSKPKSETPEDVSAFVEEHRFDGQHFERFCDLLAISERNKLPALYPQLAFTTMNICLLAHPNYGHGAFGILHLGHEVRRLEEIDLNKTYSLKSKLGNFNMTRRGLEYEISSSLIDQGVSVWSSSAKILKRFVKIKKSQKPSLVVNIPDFDRSEKVSLGRGIGPSYAKLSGDFNPIHLGPLARLFGFSQPIAHGLFIMAKIASLIEKETLAKQLDIKFMKPFELPGTGFFDHGNGSFAIYGENMMFAKGHYSPV